MLVLCLCVGGLVLRHSVTQDRAGKAGAQARAQLTDAAQRLSFTPGTRYRGSLHDSGGARWTVDARVSNEGAIIGTLTGPVSQAQLLISDDRAFVKADKAFWLTHNAPAKEIDRYAADWVKIGPELFGVDLAELLAPALLAERLAP